MVYNEYAVTCNMIFHCIGKQTHKTRIEQLYMSIMFESNELAQLDNYKTAEQCAEDLDYELDKLVFNDGNTIQPKTCFCCDCFLLGVPENTKIFGIGRLAKMC